MMATFLRSVVVSLALLVFPGSAGASENIPLYEVDIITQTNGDFVVTETIYYDFAREYRHGITRTIPHLHPQDSSAWYKERYFAIEIESVTMDDAEVPYELEDRGDELFLRIGDPYQTITTEHKYTLTYTVTGALHYFVETQPELYWNAIGADSTVPVLRGVVRVNDEAGITTGEASCYVGTVGSGERCGAASSTTQYAYEVSNLKPYQGVTLALALTDDVPEVILERLQIWYLAIPAALVALFGFIVGVWRYQTANRTGRTIIAQYEPLPDMKPMYTGVLLDDALDPKDITAAIVYLAQQGYLKIKKTSAKVLFFFEVDDYEIKLTKSRDETLSRFQNDVLDLLFVTPNVERVTLSSLKTNYAKQKENQSILNRLRSDIKKDLADSGYFQNLGWDSIKIILGLTLVAIAVSAYFFFPLAILFVVLLILFFVFSRRRTHKGYEALDHLKGFKQFLSVTEKERYAFHNAPEKSPEQFMQYLPYAIAFGVEKEWAKVFKDITIPDPEWYDGNSAGSFSAPNLTTSLGAFSTAFASSSGSSGGAGGGGSVGGGGGGGSVGSW